MSAECNRCGHDLPYNLECRFCALEAENQRLREALEDIADGRPDGKVADFHFAARAEDREQAMQARARGALAHRDKGDTG